jgi:signal transduction histidine kinase
MKDTTLEGFLSNLRRELSNSLDQANMLYSIEIDEKLENANLSLEKRKDILFISKELVNNVRKHACCQNVEIRCQKNGGMFYFSIQDDGKGFDPSFPNERNGLEFIKLRLKKWRGKIQIMTKIGEGVHTKVWIPLDKPKMIHVVIEGIKSFLRKPFNYGNFKNK